jgi:hypothetical protein
MCNLKLLTLLRQMAALVPDIVLVLENDEVVPKR